MGTSINCRERLEYKADGAQEPPSYPINEVTRARSKLREVPFISLTLLYIPIQ